VSPTKTSFFVVLTSLLVRVAAYSATSTVFPSARIAISFSSGMMILFCYCALMGGQEGKALKNRRIGLVLLAVLLGPLTVTVGESFGSTRNSKLLAITNMAYSPVLGVAMAVVVLAIVGINKSIYSPEKALTRSY